MEVNRSDHSEEMATVTAPQPETITTLVDWGYAWMPDKSGQSEGGVLILQSPTGLQRLTWPMSGATVRALRRELMGVITP